MVRQFFRWQTLLICAPLLTVALFVLWHAQPDEERRWALGYLAQVVIGLVTLACLRVRATRRHQAAGARQHRILAATVTVFLLLNLGGLLAFLFGKMLPSPHLHAAVFILGHLFLCIALWQLVSRPPRELIALLSVIGDACITLVAAALILVKFSLHQLLLADGGLWWETLLRWGYPVTLVAALLCLIVVLNGMHPHERQGARGMLVSGIVLTLFGNVVLCYFALTSATMLALLPQLCWVLGYLLIGVGAWRESSENPVGVAETADTLPSSFGMLIPIALTIIAATLALRDLFAPTGIALEQAQLRILLLVLLVIVIVLRLLTSVGRGRQAYRALQQQLAESERLVMTDTLTGIANKRACLKRLENEVARSQRYKRPLSIIFSDIDFFKFINDIHGHHVGDQALCAVAQCLQEKIRTTDLLARLGGEEFVIVLPETTLAHAALLAERLRQAVEALQLPLRGGQPVKVTISLGVAAVPETSDTVDGLLADADEAMLEAKNQGRNRVVSAQAKQHLFVVE